MKAIASSVAFAISLVSILALAAPTVQIKGGRTSVDLSDEMLNAMAGAGCEIERVKPANVSHGGERVRFPVGGGALDTGALLGEIEHKGGIAVSCPDAVDPNDMNVVTLENLRIEALDPNAVADPNDPTVVTALAAVDENVFDRIEFLVPGDSGVEVMHKGGSIKLQGVGLQLAPEAAEFLNENLGTGLAEGMHVGDSSSQLNLRKEKSPKYDKSEDHPGKGKAKGKDKEKDKDDDEDEEDDDEFDDD